MRYIHTQTKRRGKNGEKERKEDKGTDGEREGGRLREREEKERNQGWEREGEERERVRKKEREGEKGRVKGRKMEMERGEIVRGDEDERG